MQLKRRHFVMIAVALGEAKKSIYVNEITDAQGAWRECASALVRALRADNPKFDLEKFKHAVNVAARLDATNEDTDLERLNQEVRKNVPFKQPKTE